MYKRVLEQMDEKFPGGAVECQATCDSTCRDVGPLTCSRTLPPAAGAHQADSLKMIGIGAEKWAEGTGCLQVPGSARGKWTGDLDKAWK